jgi:bacillithiol system protein YtxJ
MMNGFKDLPDMTSLDSFLAQSNGDPAIIFKHSDTCGISSRAYAELAKLGRPIGLVTVQTARAVSDEIEKRMGLMHETPQVLIIHEGKVAWAASHGAVKADVVGAELERLRLKQAN